MNDLIRIHESDNAAVALRDIAAGETARWAGGELLCVDAIPQGHKVALRNIAAGENIIKYGFPIGHAKSDVAVGCHLHTHNIKSNLSGALEYTYTPDYKEPAPAEGPTFMGYPRADGSVGVRNEIWIIPTVGCVNSVARAIETELRERTGYSEIYAYTHPYGCSQLGDDQLFTQKCLSGLIRHPNAAGVLVLGLGCENNNIPELQKVLGETDPNRVKFLVAQDVEDEITAGAELLLPLVEEAKAMQRVPCPVSKLVIGLKCGGSDGFSGITANPLLGRFSDWLIARGGSAMLTEVPEMFGAETLLMNRCVSPELFDKTVHLINDFKDYFLRHGEKVDENPSPGNKAGGITTLEDKSLGCVQKGGTAPVHDVIAYGDRVKVQGLTLLQGPGNDLVSATAMAAAGAQIILFTTGRGTPFGCPVPTAKVATNHQLAARKPGWIDFDAGSLLEQPAETVLADFVETVLAIASGKPVKAEGLTKTELAIFKDGVTL
ncbi:MAG: altronate dehydratase [Clostridia bacterium]|nr:altronate dehydratase [Clostridia bacterium]